VKFGRAVSEICEQFAVFIFSNSRCNSSRFYNPKK